MPLSRLAWLMLYFLLLELFQLSALQADFALFYSLPGIFLSALSHQLFILGKAHVHGVYAFSWRVSVHTWFLRLSNKVCNSFDEKNGALFGEKAGDKLLQCLFLILNLIFFTINADFSACCCFLDRKTQLLPKHYCNVCSSCVEMNVFPFPLDHLKTLFDLAFFSWLGGWRRRKKAPSLNPLISRMKSKSEASSILLLPPPPPSPWMKYTDFSESLSNWKLRRRNTYGAQMKTM